MPKKQKEKNNFFLGETLAMNGHFIMLPNENNEKDQYPEFIKALRVFTSKTMELLEGVVPVLIDFENRDIVTPPIPEKDTNRRDEMILELEIKEYMKRTQAQQKNLIKPFATIIENCSNKLQRVIKVTKSTNKKL